MFGSEMRDAAARIRRLLTKEEEDKAKSRRQQAMAQQLRASGWQPTVAATPAVQGPALADAARAIQVGFNAEEAYQAEAQRRLSDPGEYDVADGSSLPAFASEGPIGAPRTSQPATARPGAWHDRAVKMAEYLGLDPDLVTAASTDPEVDIAGILMGLQGYRHLDRFGQYELNRAIAKLQREHPQLYGTIQLKQAGSIASPYQDVWALSDDEIDKRMAQNAAFLEGLDSLGDAQDVGSVAAPLAMIQLAPKFTPATATLTAMLLGTKWMTKGEQEMLQRELEARRRGNYPFRQDQNP
jgi:hypothetical protein